MTDPEADAYFDENDATAWFVSASVLAAIDWSAPTPTVASGCRSSPTMRRSSQVSGTGAIPRTTSRGRYKICSSQSPMPIWPSRIFTPATPIRRRRQHSRCHDGALGRFQKFHDFAGAEVVTLAGLGKARQAQLDDLCRHFFGGRAASSGLRRRRAMPPRPCISDTSTSRGRIHRRSSF